MIFRYVLSGCLEYNLHLKLRDKIAKSCKCVHMFEMLAMTWTCLVFRKDKLPPPFGLDVLGSVSAKTSSSLSRSKSQISLRGPPNCEQTVHPCVVSLVGHTACAESILKELGNNICYPLLHQHIEQNEVAIITSNTLK